MQKPQKGEIYVAKSQRGDTPCAASCRLNEKFTTTFNIQRTTDSFSKNKMALA